MTEPILIRGAAVAATVYEELATELAGLAALVPGLDCIFH